MPGNVGNAFHDALLRYLPKRKKVFISYAWKDKEIIDNMIDKLQTSGIRVFMDRQSIDYGDHILESILSGLSECELALFF